MLRKITWICEFKCMLLDLMSRRIVLSDRAGMLTNAYSIIIFNLCNQIQLFTFIVL